MGALQSVEIVGVLLDSSNHQPRGGFSEIEFEPLP